MKSADGWDVSPGKLFWHSCDSPRGDIVLVWVVSVDNKPDMKGDAYADVADISASVRICLVSQLYKSRSLALAATLARILEKL